MNVIGLILAAGEGSRMGGAVKQMLPFKGKTILENVIDNAVASQLQQVVVIIGHRADIVEPVINGRNVGVVINRDYRKGQSSSIRAGLRALPEKADAVLFMLGDQPLVAPETINRILHGFEASRKPIVIPVYDGKRGNPALFSRETFSRLELLDGDCGGRSLFEEYAAGIFQLPVDDPYILFDLDTDEDYRGLFEL